jgi:hypothetical protein
MTGAPAGSPGKIVRFKGRFGRVEVFCQEGLDGKLRSRRFRARLTTEDGIVEALASELEFAVIKAYARYGRQRACTELGVRVVVPGQGEDSQA